MASYEGQITLINVHDGAGTPGAPGPTYILDTNQDEILRFATEREGFTFSPEILTIQVRKFMEDSNTIQSVDYDNLLVYFYSSGEWKSLDLVALGENVNIENNTMSIHLASLSKITDGSQHELVNLLVSSETALKLEYYVNKVLVQNKIIGIRYGLSADMARLSLNAEGIVASIQDAGLRFDANGLTIKNGNFSILSDHYEPVTITAFDENKEYYIQTASGFEQIDKAGGIVEGQQYYVYSLVPVLNADENGNLKITGVVNATDGQFTGTIYATDGIFNGFVNAKGGIFSDSIEVQGFLSVGQNSDKIYVGSLGKDGGETTEGIFSSNFDKEGNQGFCLNPDGSIIANNIQLGDSASIKNYLRLGDNCCIYNPTYNNGQFIVVGGPHGPAVSLNDNGTLRLGQDDSYIILDGINNRISTKNFLSGYSGWEITQERAEFNNIVARGTLESSVLAHGKIQTIGGILLVRPSTIIKSYKETTTGYVVYPETTLAGFKVGDYCQIGNQGTLYVIVEYNTINGNEEIVLTRIGEQATLNEIIVLDETNYSNKSIVGEILVSYGQTQPAKLDEHGNVLVEEKPSIGIAINSSDSSSSVAPHAISVFKNVFAVDETGKVIFKKEPVIVLGEMDGEGYGGLTGYGLYADNVYLKGSLISEYIDPGAMSSFYSGISTSSKVLMPEGEDGLIYFPGKARGDILFWAGAKTSEKADIASAPFKVDTYGNLYAGSGFFNGTIISNATISAAKIRAAVIEGWSLSDNTSAALSIIDVQKAINFQKKVINEAGNEDYVTVMSLEEDGMTLNVPLKVGNFLVDPDNGSVQLDNFFVQDNLGNKSELDISKLIFLKHRGASSALVKTVIKADIESFPGLQFHVLDQDVEESDSSCILQLTRERSYITNDLQCANNLFISNTIEYRQATNSNGEIIGYDLYVKE